MTSRFPSAVLEMTVVHIFIRCFFSLNQLELEARPMLYHLPVSCTQPLLSHQLGADPVSPLGRLPAPAQVTSRSPASLRDGVLGSSPPRELLQLLASTKPSSQETPGL